MILNNVVIRGVFWDYTINNIFSWSSAYRNRILTEEVKPKCRRFLSISDYRQNTQTIRPFTFSD